MQSREECEKRKERGVEDVEETEKGERDVAVKNKAQHLQDATCYASYTRSIFDPRLNKPGTAE